MRLELRMESIFGKPFERQLELLRELRMASYKPTRGPKKSRRGEKQAFHARTLRSISEGVAG